MSASLARKKTKKSVHEKRLRKRIAIGVAIFGIACLVTVWQRVSVEETLRDIGRLEKQLQELEDRNAELEVTLAQLRDFRRISKIAQEQKGLGFPERITLTIPSEYAKLIKEDANEVNF